MGGAEVDLQSQQEYRKGVSNWNFDLEALRAAAAADGGGSAKVQKGRFVECDVEDKEKKAEAMEARARSLCALARSACSLALVPFCAREPGPPRTDPGACLAATQGSIGRFNVISPGAERA